MSTDFMRRPGGNWAIHRIDKAEHYQTVLYEIDMLRYSYARVLNPPEAARDADVWAYLESFLVHYRNLLDLFGKPQPRETDLTLEHPEMIWSAGLGFADRQPGEVTLAKMRILGLKLWKKYEDRSKSDTISRYLQRCTTYRTSPNKWFCIEMMAEISELVVLLEQHLPEFRPATESHLVSRDHFPGGEPVSTHSRPDPQT
jgi:hypothetical protein